MGCRGCKKAKQRLKERLLKEKEKTMEPVEYKNLSDIRQKEHFMKVCPHGVPHGFKCGGCDKIIAIPEDAKVKEAPKEEKEDK